MCIIQAFSRAAHIYLIMWRTNRMSNLSQSTRRTRGSNIERMPERIDTFHRQISRWAKDREKVQHAATKHASWLAGMCEELKEYGAKYKQDGTERREAEAAITLLEEDEHDCA